LPEKFPFKSQIILSIFPRVEIGESLVINVIMIDISLRKMQIEKECEYLDA